MRGTKEKGKRKHCLLLIVGPVLGADHIIIKTTVKNHTEPETLLCKQMQIKNGNRLILNMFRGILIHKNKSKSKI